MKLINIYAAKTQLSQIVDRASKGESFVIAKSGTPLAKLVPLDDSRPAKIRFGLMKGKIRIEPDFDAPLPDAILDAFEGGSSA
ncbi:type II toxin-antitoxin system prevent-host-death family antitoxin [Inquilinus limosus]|uniref:type II toxin-antitoxin system Phd/YefM family antitoxin n=1 Tax=Inquilinus limosus TaxID=171674 RepID=UPI003F192B83